MLLKMSYSILRCFMTFQVSQLMHSEIINLNIEITIPLTASLGWYPDKVIQNAIPGQKRTVARHTDFSSCLTELSPSASLVCQVSYCLCYRCIIQPPLKLIFNLSKEPLKYIIMRIIYTHPNYAGH